MLLVVPDFAQALAAIPAVSVTLLAWQLWALLSELLLAATHLKVLLCIGKPIPVDELSTKRWTYFLYDLVSPWFSLASIVTSYTLPLAAARTLTANSSDSAAGMAGSDASQAQSQQPYQCNAATVMDPLFNSTFQQQQLPLDPAAAAAAIGPNITAAATPLQQLLLLFIGAHAALHLFYIASWHSAHSKNVVQMSASSSMGSRTKQFNFVEVVWFFIGTGYDILTHVIMCALLLQSLASSYRALRM